jgi:hypothetical protein
MDAWPKDEAGWPKKLSAEDEAAHIAGLGEKEAHCMQGLGGSQKAEVAWMDKHGIAYEEHDVEMFDDWIRSMVPEKASQKLSQQEGLEPGANPMHCRGNTRPAPRESRLVHASEQDAGAPQKLI